MCKERIMDERRRALLIAGVAAGGWTLLSPNAQAQTMTFAPVPPLPVNPTPGRPGDFNFLAGEWRISHRQLQGATKWDEFHGEATCWTILGGVGSVEELRIPARNFSGMALRLLDVQNRTWSDF